MAESTLSLALADLRTEVSDFLGLGRTYASLSAGNQARVTMCIKRGLAQFYYPPPMNAGEEPHDWSFLHPVGSMVLWADIGRDAVRTVTNTYASPTTTITATSASFYASMVGRTLRIYHVPPAATNSYVIASNVVTVTCAAAHWLTSAESVTIENASELHINGTWTVTVTGANTFTFTLVSTHANVASTTDATVAGYRKATIAGYTSATVVTATGDYATHTAALTWSMESEGLFALPDNFGGLRGGLSYAPNAATEDVEVVPEYAIRIERQGGTTTGAPYQCAIRPLSSTGLVGQRWELLVWPTPDQDYTVALPYDIFPDAPVATTNEYLLGGMEHSDTIMASCEDLAQQTLDDTIGAKHQRFLERLAASIGRDRLHEPTHYGYNGNRERVRVPGQFTVTYNGEIP